MPDARCIPSHSWHTVADAPAEQIVVGCLACGCTVTLDLTVTAADTAAGQRLAAELGLLADA